MWLAPATTTSTAMLGEVGVGVLPGVAVGVLDSDVDPCDMSPQDGGVRFPDASTEADDIADCVEPGRTLGGIGGAAALHSLTLGGNIGGTF